MATYDEHATLTATLRNAAARMANAEHSAQFDAARKEHDAARKLLDEYNARHSADDI
jgi:hypothetical protein